MHTLRALVTVVALAALGAPLAAAAGPEPDPPASPAARVPRVRPYDGRSAALLLEGIRRSATVRGLVERLEASDLIVYVEMQQTLRGRWAGSLTWVAATAKCRYVRISINPDLRGGAGIALLGHELQHAVEIADEPSVVDAASMNDFYRRIGFLMRTHNNGWDTMAARDVGDVVRRDLTEAQSARIVESIQDFDPAKWQVLYRRARGTRE